MNMEIQQAKTVKDARRLARKGRRHVAYVTISDDTGIHVRVSRKAILDALSEIHPDEKCGGRLRGDTFFLDRP